MSRLNRILLSCAALAGAIRVASAQVSVDMNALTSPAPAAPASPIPPPQAVHRPTPPGRPATPARPVIHQAAKPAPAAPAAKPPALPVTPPATVSLPPPVTPPPAAKPAQPVPPPINNAAGGDAAPYEQGLRVAFASGHFDLSPQTADAITGLARSLASRDTVTLELRAYAAPVADDPSTPRRLALSRALAIRETLLQAGVPSMRIFVRTLGSPSDGSAADRVDIVPMQPVDRPPKTAQSP